MFEVTVTMSFSAAHNLRGYRGKCEELHGHNWKVEATLAADGVDGIGMVEDFSAIKRRLHRVLSLFDHKYLNDLSFFKTANPTSENLARLIFQKMKTNRSRARISSVKVWETETSHAVYREP